MYGTTCAAVIKSVGNLTFSLRRRTLHNGAAYVPLPATARHRASTVDGSAAVRFNCDESRLMPDAGLLPLEANRTLPRHPPL
jgi:hypothetical protein